MRRTVLSCGLGLLLGAGALGLTLDLARAQTPPDNINRGDGANVGIKSDDVIAARQAGYDLMAGELIGIKAVVDANGDVKPLVDPSKALASWGRAVPSMFPDGTQTGHHTHARPEIWSDRPGFEKAASNFVDAADKLAQLAEADDKAGYAAQYKVTTQTCGACHRNYRVKD